MKRIYLYLIIIVACILSSCNLGGRGKGVLPIELVQAENIMYENPDSALHILQAMPIPIDKEAHATWALLLAQAKYKCDVKQSDSLVYIAYDYFKIKDFNKKKVLALYIRGGIENDNNQYERALKLFLDAEKELNVINDDTLGFLITSHIGLIYAYQKIDKYAIEYSVKAYDYALSSQYYKYIIAACIQLARTYSNINIDESIKYYEKAIELARKHKDTKQMARALIEVSGRYKDHPEKQYLKAMNAIKEAIKIRQSAQAYIVLGNIYQKIGQNDSARFYLEKASKSDNIYTARNAYKTLYKMNKELGNYKKAAEYSEELWDKQDSINKIARNKVIAEMQAKYDQQKIINEKNRAEKKGLIILCTSIGLIGIIILCYQWKVLCQNRELKKKEKELTDFVNQLNENKQIIAQNIARIKELEGKEEMSAEQQKEKQESIEEMQKQNKSLENKNQDLLQKIDEYTTTMAEKSKELEGLRTLSENNLYLHRRELFLCNELLKKEEFVNKIKKNPKPLDVIQWRDIMSKTDAIYDNYTIRLRTRIPELTENDIHICCLIKLSFSNGDIAKILGISPTSVSRQKLRLKERIIQQVGSLGENVLLDIWLKEF